MNSINIKEILTRISQEDRKAFDIFFEYYYPRLLKFAVHYVKSYENAEEIVGDVFVKLLKRRDKMKDIENFNGYIYHSVKNQALTFISKKKPDLFLNNDEEDYLMVSKSNPETEFLDHELSEQLKQTIESMPLRRKMIYKLVKEDGLKYQEVADLLEVSVKTVEVHMGLAINNVKEAIINYLSDQRSLTPIKKIIPIVLLLAANLI